VSADSPLALAARIATLADGRRPLVALDHDGTLSPIAPRPEDAVLVAGAREALVRLTGVAEVAIVSGRGLDDLAARFGGLRVALVAEHGLRHRRRDGTVEQLTDGLDARTLAELRPRLEKLLADEEGWLVEDKGVGLAVHHRLVPDARIEPTLGRVRALLEAAASRPAARAGSGPGGHVQAGKAVLELRPAGADKGGALRHLAGSGTSARTPERTPPVVMVGDDLTDEPALAAAEQLGGVGVLVADAPRPTSASARLSGPEQVVALLDALAVALAVALAGPQTGSQAGPQAGPSDDAPGADGRG